MRMSSSAIAALLALAALPALADRPATPPPPPAYMQECGSCHVAYPARLLPAVTWQRVMGNLERHYGVDASLDAATAQPLAAWLTAWAARGRRASAAPPEDRITRSRWFVREHDEVPPATWLHAAVKSAANCAACHRGAEQGDFDDDDVRIPR